MARRIVLTGAVVLLLSSSSFAIYQHEDFVLFSETIAERIADIGLAHDGKLLPSSNIQINRDVGSGSTAMQIDRVMIGQRASAWGLGGTSGAGQMGLGIGYQDQIVGGHAATVQKQGLGLSFSGTAYKAGGVAGAGGTQHGMASRMQTALTPDGVSRQSGHVFSVQFGRVTGSGDSNSSMAHTLEVLTEQSQAN